MVELEPSTTVVALAPWPRVTAVGEPRAVAAAGLGAFLVLAVGFTDGGYYGRAATALTLAFAAVAALGVLHGGTTRLSRAGLTVLAALVALVGLGCALVGVGGTRRARRGEVRRAVVYACALAAVLLTIFGPRREPLLLGLLGGISLLGAVAIAMRASSGEVVDRFYGTLLEEPVGYPNALGVLAALGITLAVGLADGRGLRDRVFGGSAALLVLVLGLSGSRGAALALGVGLCLLVALRAPGTRVAAALGAVPALVVGGAAWAVAVRVDAGGLGLVGLAVGAALVGRLVRVPDRLATRRALIRWERQLSSPSPSSLSSSPIATTSSFRTAYWAAALDEARARPALGSGAGSFHLTWSERGREGVFVRDAHSLYVETLTELGPVGLALVLVLVAVPIATAIRGRGEPLVAVSGAAFAVFAVHAGIDWDWEMPAVTLAALGCCGVLLVRQPSDVGKGTR